MKILYITTISLTMNSFFKPHVEMLVHEGHRVEIACNYEELPLDEKFGELGCTAYQIDFMRSPLSRHNVKAYRQLKSIIEQGQYDIIHCHTPVAAMLTRLAARRARKHGTKVYYTAHGFHFFKGAPLLNWLVYFPIELICSYMTDVLITINREDHALAKKHMHAGTVEYVPGVGIDLKRFRNVDCYRAEKRRSIGVPTDAMMLLSVGELNDNKNHQIIIKAMNILKDMNNLHYVLAGVGPNAEMLEKLANDYGLGNRVHLLGYRSDIPELNKAADIFCFPSHREGLGLAALEAMASGVPVITSNVHGINDYSENGKTGYKCAPNDEQAFAVAIRALASDAEQRKCFGEAAREIADRFDLTVVLDIMKRIYGVA